MSLSDQLLHKVHKRVSKGSHGALSAIFNDAQKQAIGYALSAIRHQLRTDQAAAVAKLERRLDQLESLVGHPDQGGKK